MEALVNPAIRQPPKKSADVFRIVLFVHCDSILFHRKGLASGFIRLILIIVDFE